MRRVIILFKVITGASHLPPPANNYKLLYYRISYLRNKLLQSLYCYSHWFY